ncbi:hypothetical protein B1F79_02250 [Coxiella-like endosymbiont of Rhipicephalus sanguineus]|nr:hypothetical protein [Coxiella-like endosymbiont of Rhipicephalus sanguineus]
MKVLEKRRGVLGLCFYSPYVSERNSILEDFIQHILHAINVMSDEHFGIRGDYDSVPPDSQIVIKNLFIIQKLWKCFNKQEINRATLIKNCLPKFFKLLE